ncbi:MULTISPECIES: STAS domain-containing protein [unclassified Endozoicomonas]|uniref:STAS domain-containing protein n=1 Tax=unclassified Endozoicomonas TaxID=2644528 RepID=UPI002147D197|nr:MULTISPECIES: STAS domain-containing protein [unclassified Endozoicomonas]
MAFENHEEGHFTVVRIDESRLDASVAEVFKTYVFDLIEEGRSNIVVDLAEVRFMDSTGLSVLVAGLKKLSGNGSFSLACAQPAVRDLFDLTSMDKLFKLHGSVAEAVKGS